MSNASDLLVTRAPESLLIVDTETDGINPAKDKIVEIAAVLFSVQHACVISAWSELIRPETRSEDGSPLYTNVAEPINRISPASLGDGLSLADATAALQRMAARAQAVVAHNAAFDNAFLGNRLDPLSWICTMDDVLWPRHSSAQNLVAIALAHDIGIVQAHRALVDCMTIARLFERAHELSPGCLPTMLLRAMRPKALFQASVPFERKDLAKQAGFRWEGESKRWLRRMSIEDASRLEFATINVDELETKAKMTTERVGTWLPDTEQTLWRACSCEKPLPRTVTYYECLTCLSRTFRPRILKAAP